LFIAGIGVYTICNPDPLIIENRLGLVSAIWSGFILTAVPASIAVLLGRYRIESILLPLFGSAIAVAMISVWGRVLLNAESDLIARAALGTGLLCLLVVRGLQLHRIIKAEPWITTER
jgi:hypothetical protein